MDVNVSYGDQDLFKFRLHCPGVSYGAFIKTLEHMRAEKGRVNVLCECKYWSLATFSY